MELSEHLFRRESARMVAALTHLFGIENLQLAEDVVQDAFCRALDVWAHHGVPPNPSAWLMATAKNRTIDLLRRETTVRSRTQDLGRLYSKESFDEKVVEKSFEPHEIEDDLLRMMFSCCHPLLPEVAQVSLILHILCGLGMGEVASALVTPRSTVEKRIQRAKKVLARSKTLFNIGSHSDFPARLPAVQRALYLLFNEGYHGASEQRAVRVELCREALRLVTTLLDYPQGSVPSTYAVAALMCFCASRLPARIDEAGNLHSLPEQDRSQWDRELIGRGFELLDLSAAGSELSEYHLEASIAAQHAVAQTTDDTNWGAIVALYDKLLDLKPSPIVALNRAVAFAQLHGPESGIEAIRTIVDRERLASYPFYEATLGEFELRRGNRETAREHFRRARSFGRNSMERRFLESKIAACDEVGGREKPVRDIDRSAPARIQ